MPLLWSPGHNEYQQWMNTSNRINHRAKQKILISTLKKCVFLMSCLTWTTPTCIHPKFDTGELFHIFLLKGVHIPKMWDSPANEPVARHTWLTTKMWIQYLIVQRPVIHGIRNSQRGRKYECKMGISVKEKYFKLLSCSSHHHSLFSHTDPHLLAWAVGSLICKYTLKPVEANMVRKLPWRSWRRPHRSEDRLGTEGEGGNGARYSDFSSRCDVFLWQLRTSKFRHLPFLLSAS